MIRDLVQCLEQSHVAWCSPQAAVSITFLAVIAVAIGAGLLASVMTDEWW